MTAPQTGPRAGRCPTLAASCPRRRRWHRLRTRRAVGVFGSPWVSVNPTTGLQLPAVRGRRDRVAAPQEAAKLLELVPEGDRAIWGTAMYAGLRRGELLALAST